MDVLKFSPWQSSVDLGFWQELGTKKLEELKLSEEPLEIAGSFCRSRHSNVSSHLELGGSAFGKQILHGHQGYINVPGTLYIVNTNEGFQAFDRKAAAKSVAESIFNSITTGNCLDNPSLLCSFLLVTYADLKSYQYHYWFGFPALKPPSPFTASPNKNIQEAMGKEKAARVLQTCETWKSQRSPVPFWVIENPDKENLECRDLSQLSDVLPESAMLCMSDPCHLSGYPGWILRNCLFLLAHRWRCRAITVVCIRERQGSPDPLSSLLFEVSLPDIPLDWGKSDVEFVPGWEMNADGKKAARFMNLRSQFDPHQLSEEAVNLNLRLMLWRAAPNLDTQKIADCKCLLLGMGTLGCMVARTLMGWGIKNVSLLDSGHVSFSNPVRQSLYEFEDCLEGGKGKAKCASEHLKNIFPSMRPESYDFAIPMPGHPPRGADEGNRQKQAVQSLDELVSSHDVVFLLTDTRESRWLPTLMCAARGTLAINIALGFDGFLVMRHGGELQGGKKLGCYFCNDVVAPLNSLTDRALDQQCTVARPGLAPMAAALGVEMMIALLQHPLGINAPGMNSLSSSQDDDGHPEGALGAVPHMIRGSLLGFSTVCMEGENFSRCTACSPSVLDGYSNDPWGFVQKAILDPKHLEDLTGLTALAKEMEERLQIDCDFSENESDCQSEDWTAL